MKRKWHGSALLLLCAALLLASCGLEPGIGRGPLAIIHSVDVMKGGGAYVAQIKGNYPDSCSTTGNVEQEVRGQTLTVRVYTKQKKGASCDPVPTPFSDRIPLEVKGLSRGQYTVSVNGTVATLTLLTDQ